jgi:hypothetical protein
MRNGRVDAGVSTDKRERGRNGSGVVRVRASESGRLRTAATITYTVVYAHNANRRFMGAKGSCAIIAIAAC